MSKCKCGVLALGFINNTAVCRNCFIREYVNLGGVHVKRSETARDENGVLRAINSMKEYSDYISGERFLSCQPTKVRNRGYVKASSLPRLIAEGRLVALRESYFDKSDVVVDEFGVLIAPTSSDRYTCSSCKKGFVSVYPATVGSGAICHSCYTKSGKKRQCRACGAESDVSLSIELNSIGVKEVPYCTCSDCVKKNYLPLSYHSKNDSGGSGNTIGIEVECEPTVDSQIRLATWYDAGHMVTGSTDGSLRGKYPCEFVSPIIHESDYESWLTDFGNRLDARVYTRCGLHIHVGTSEYSWFEINNMMRYIKAYEGVFFSIVSPSRSVPEMLNGNNAGLPVYLPDIPTFSRREDLLDWCYGKEHTRKDVGSNIHKSKRCNDKQVHYNGHLNRYQWINFHGHFFKGAIEVRSHQGTANVEKMRNWIELWLNILPHATLPERMWKNPFRVMPKHLELYYVERAKQFAEMKRGKKIKID